MILGTYSILDQKAGIFSPPFFTVHEALAIRMVQNVVSDLSTSIGQHPADFALFSLGTFDDQTGQFQATTPTMIVPCLQLQPRPKD